MNETPSLSSSVKLNPKVVVRRTSYGAVLLDTETGGFWELNPVGADVWSWLVEGCPLDQVLERIHVTYDAPRPNAEADLMALLSELTVKGLIEILR